jgi:predicted TIM-barrel fold metal-dependent hydrolase
VRLTFMRDASGVFARALLGDHLLLWSSDYPHTDSTWPDSRRVVERIFRGVPEAEKRQTTLENAAALYGIDVARLAAAAPAIPA